MHELVKTNEVSDADKKATVTAFDQVLGLDIANWAPKAQADVPDNVMQLVEQRQQARADKDWAAADKARDELDALGYEVIDTPDGPEVKTK